MYTFSFQVAGSAAHTSRDRSVNTIVLTAETSSCIQTLCTRAWSDKCLHHIGLFTLFANLPWELKFSFFSAAFEWKTRDCMYSICITGRQSSGFAELDLTSKAAICCVCQVFGPFIYSEFKFLFISMVDIFFFTAFLFYLEHLKIKKNILINLI